jgi:hypothetical protein
MLLKSFDVKEFHKHLGHMFTSDEAKQHTWKIQRSFLRLQIKVKRGPSKSVVKENVW